MSCHLEREPGRLGGGWDVGVDGDSEQFRRAVWQGGGERLCQGEWRLLLTVAFCPLPSQQSPETSEWAWPSGSRPTLHQPPPPSEHSQLQDLGSILHSSSWPSKCKFPLKSSHLHFGLNELTRLAQSNSPHAQPPPLPRTSIT